MTRRHRFVLPSGRSLAIREAPGVHPPDPYAARMAAALRLRRGDRVLDLGCGAGGYGLAAAARGAARVVLTDVDPAAVRCALENAARNGLGGIEGRVGTFFQPVRGEVFDVIVTSLPQLPAPRRIIETRYGGRDGLQYLRRLAASAAAHLAPGGRLYVLVTDWAYPPRVAPLFTARGYRLRRVERVERAFQPAEYDRMAPGLFAYLHRRATANLARYRREGTWCYLGISLLEARLPAVNGSLTGER
jgi:methylase of polypeptide subunit release factors